MRERLRRNKRSVSELIRLQESQIKARQRTLANDDHVSLGVDNMLTPVCKLAHDNAKREIRSTSLDESRKKRTDITESTSLLSSPSLLVLARFGGT